MLYNGYNDRNFSVSNSDDGNYTLSIPHLKVTDTGVYSCVEDNGAAAAEHFMQLVVTNKTGG